ncbi:TetR/AcrR family transcriptional regulator [Streptomyces sp. NBC_01497]|uniref:TetR/AcrR family transcriptional regulator n=1 Tax=Streptomyces sp. NBC_01497 TaxID=2903885 RepID=UPI002E33DC76|nr:WHG domain-containing protein [Streptomyces sp. NBC_01497]
MPRAGLNTDRVVAEAAVMADEVGLNRVTLAGLATRLGVRQPSLYKHVESLDSLQQRIAVQAKGELADVWGRAVMGRARDDALVAMAHAYRTWAQAHPGRYVAAQRAPVPGNAEDEAVSARAVQVVAAVIDGYGLHGDEAIDAIRAFRAALHGFVSLEAGGAFALRASVDRSFDRLIQALRMALSSWGDVCEPGSEMLHEQKPKQEPKPEA